MDSVADPRTGSGGTGPASDDSAGSWGEILVI